MGGDHKCPVCQATFTRPQHVARHMRSHTGDRPYKCQYCGDQFARSDLLSRHVNKCHANEKPLPLSGGTRRKGSASASRATTSKQACDQCVQSSLPCDGCNPCSKCVQRKCRCTFVKFHRQTAPAGPGHNLRPNAPAGSAGLVPLPSASTSRLPMFPQQPEDDFILGPPPTSSASGVHTMAETLYNSNSFAFPALYPTEPSLGTDPVDYASKYRAQAQAELFGPGRSGLGTGLTPLYDPRGGSSAATGAAGWLGWDNQPQPPHPDSGDAYHHHQQHHPQQQPHQQDHGRHADFPASSGGSAMHDKHLLQQQQPPPPHYMSMSLPYPGAGTGTGNINGSGGSTRTDTSGRSSSSDRGGPTSSDRRGSVDLVGSDFGGGGGNEYEYEYSGGSDGDGSHSIPSSATSSSVHLPLGMGMMGAGGHQQQHQQQQQQQRRLEQQHQHQQAMYDERSKT
ncbi:hypothetical protein CVT25_008262 [Psilocybe cyanescens]|uniref:Zn(2)-C6 fungal-type domain-containing protein n=1 Tax=Psilocybe cyanescens TaxID=93625 RepID=A0A409XN36_PSICY|nr:hypothetical protein CVT25_008262 [Psilocybe cyanescens]